MAYRTYEITGDLPYYELECDRCARRFRLYDDSGYHWETLCRTAAGEGWSAPPNGRQYCPGCVYSSDFVPDALRAGFDKP